jgi:recombinational DNA repair protein (RecF pathway)
MLKLVHKLSQQGVTDSPETFNLLGNGLTSAEDSRDLEKLTLHFELKLLAAQGVLPHEEIFRPWLAASLAEHESIACAREDLRRVRVQVHEHLRQYLGSEIGGERR